MNSKVFYFPEIPPRSPYFNLAIEEAIALKLVSEGMTAGVRLWKNPDSIILGLSENPFRNIKEEVVTKYESVVKSEGFHKKPKPNFCYIARRASGGGTVFHSLSGNINYSLYFNLEERKDLFPVRDSYDILLGIVSKSLKRQNIVSFPKGKSDLVLEKNGILKKISGNAQFRKRSCIVQHGTLILEDHLIERVAEVLHHPPEEPDYRKERSHKEFLTSLPDFFSEKIWAKDLVKEVFSYLGEKEPEDFSKISFFGPDFSTFRKQVLRESESIRKKKYQNPEYTLHREIPT
ncbi:lipoate--protein ligase family protein [Leptospira bandrabouensis]|uniref:Lipoate--protein ligase family protein n=1 Tax=Leptospira bandrabouensis TaxID=2484903 RepID=A0A6H3NRS1_9LEPT|nr:lipoate--protein ligase family protein [Leptospira bandrabouensis]MCG6143023.1 lipoate--protein ligase family protein [Leptospira bandrabouensis]MCG6158682.1 lipoate--protein ligase family protein [Leptospira bandrabouensis]MCG6162618.1 lipoate--protein ligase family protein [Leptospira bandrabouensis]MCW7459928.1 lipoate--protein ligase family protein [Leptospira bandrabouensis]MCW7477195.1 lipoate--protein ligase family protein [Leptospira bandrabouensis]